MHQKPDYQFIPHFFSEQEADRLFQKLKNELDWQQTFIKIYGKTVLEPRLTAYYGTQNYAYSGRINQAKPFSKSLLVIKNAIEEFQKVTYNAVLCNFYRHGLDSMGWHSDNEPELGPNPIIASVSLGAVRKFQFKNKIDKTLKHEILLNHGSLLIMYGNSQSDWLHQIPKTKKDIGERINLTFRNIIS